jgi:hypothetical protein
MKLYVNGDSHTAGAEAVNSCAFAEDDRNLRHLGRLPHPANLAVSWGRRLADAVKAGFYCDAESAASNARIIRTTRAWLEEFPERAKDTVIIIQWSTWERQEWLIDGKYFQINASGVDVVPQAYQEKYKHYILGIDYKQVTQQAHEEVWAFHDELAQMGVRHVFFNGNNSFDKVAIENRKDWGVSYIDPYDKNSTYDQWLKNNGFDTVSPRSYHFGKAAHAAWANFVLQYIIANKLI